VEADIRTALVQTEISFAYVDILEPLKRKAAVSAAYA
jgi:hypothetical protein